MKVKFELELRKKYVWWTDGQPWLVVAIALEIREQPNPEKEISY